MNFESIKNCYSPQEYPALDWQIREWGKTKPLKGLKILDGAPVFRNTVVKYCALMAAGADLTVGISDVMPYDPEIVAFLREQGIKIVHAGDEPCMQDIILDCAGAFAHWPSKLGVSELTRSGAHVYAELGKPVFLADEGRIKRIETCLGTGDGLFRALEQMGHSEYRGRRIIVFGSGKVGTGIIYHAVKRGAVVDVVTDPSTVSPYVRGIVRTVVDFSDKAAVEKLFQDSDTSSLFAVVTATGMKGAVESCCSASTVISSKALLANMGVEDEFGETFPAEAVLNGKRPLNFILEEPTQMRYIETTMALHNQGTIFLALRARPAGIYTPPPALEDHLLNIVRQNGLIADELELIDEVSCLPTA